MTSPAPLPAQNSTAWFPWAQKVDNAAVEAINVKDYGALGDGSTDDSTAFQNAVNAAAAAGCPLVIPAPSSFYKIASTVTIQPQSGTQVRMDIVGCGIPGSIRWAGAASGVVFSALGWKRSTVSGVHISTNGVASVTAWDLDTSVSYGSLSLVTFTNCFVDLGAQAGNGWRLGHVSGGGADLSFLMWLNCSVNGNTGGAVTTNAVGWLNEGGNCLNINWNGGFGSYLDRMVSNQGATTGNDSMFFYALGGSHNSTDFEFAAPGAYTISGGRFEVGARFLNVTSASNHAAVTVRGVNLSSYAPGDGILAYMGRPGSLLWDGNYVKTGGSAYTAAAFTLDGFTGLGTFHARGGAIQGADPFYTLAYSGWQVLTEGVGLLNSSAQSTTRALTRAADVADPSNPFVPANVAWQVNPLAADTRTLVPTLSQLTLHVFYSGFDGVTIDQLDAFVNTVGSATAVLRAGVYKLADQSRPFARTTNPWGTLLVDAGTVNTAVGTGQKVWTLGSALVIAPFTWFAVGGADQTATAATRTVGGVTGALYGSKIGVSSASTGSYGTGTSGIAFVFTSITGALPSSLTGPAGTSNVDSGVGFHRSA